MGEAAVGEGHSRRWKQAAHSVSHGAMEHQHSPQTGVISQRYERGATIVTLNLAFEDWTSVFGSERLTGALLDRLTYHVHILEMNGDSYRLKQSKARRTKQSG